MSQHGHSLCTCATDVLPGGACTSTSGRIPSSLRVLSARAKQRRSAFSYDPTRTITLREKFCGDMTRRFKFIQKLITRNVAERDVFGLFPRYHSPLRVQSVGSGVPPQPTTTGNSPLFDELANTTSNLHFNADLPERAFEFSRSGDKVEAFMAWLEDEVRRGVLQIVPGPTGRRVVGASRWTDVYIASAYKKGIGFAWNMMKAEDADVTARQTRIITPGSGADPIQSSFLSPTHADRAGLIYTRTYSDLKGVTDEMDKQISRSLAESLSEGRDPYQTARILNERVEAIGITRARTIARTEMIRAHHVASINTYREAGIEGVVVIAEWMATPDDRVCDECEELDGKEFPLDEIEGMIPVHPNCRCAAVPKVVNDEEQTPDKEGEDNGEEE